MTKLNRKIGWFLATLAVVALLSWVLQQPVRLAFYSSRAADCTISSLNWDKDRATVVVGETANMRVIGSAGCFGHSLAMKIYEEDRGATDDVIVQIPSSFNASGTGFARYQFSQADYEQGGDESGQENMYFLAIVDGQEITDKESPPLYLARPTGATNSCRLSGAKWNHNTKNGPIVGTTMQMIVTGIGCANEPINYHIWEEDGVVDDDIAEVVGKFNSDGTAALTTYQLNAAGAGDNYGSYEFYFTVQVGNSKVQSENLLVPVNSESGCLNCNNGSILPDILKCADGTEIQRGINQSYKGLCSTHVGDALGGTNASGDDDFGFPTEPGTTGQPLSTKFRLDNPLKGNPLTIAGWIKLLTDFIFKLAIPISVLIILYGGFLMLISGGNPGQYQKGLTALKYATIGFAVLLISGGFVELVKSILSVGK